MNTRIFFRGLITVLGLSTVGTGVWYITENTRVHTTTAAISSDQSAILNNQVALVRLRQALTDNPPGNQPITVVPTTASQPDLLRLLQEVATASAVSIAASSFTDTNGSATSQKSASVQGEASVTVSIQVSGSSDALLKFVHQLQNGRRLAVISTAQMNNTVGATSQLVLQVAFPYGSKG